MNQNGQFCPQFPIIPILQNTYVSLMKAFIHTVLLNHEIVCQIKARVPDPAIRSVQADHKISVDL